MYYCHHHLANVTLSVSHVVCAILTSHMLFADGTQHNGVGSA